MDRLTTNQKVGDSNPLGRTTPVRLLYLHQQLQNDFVKVCYVGLCHFKLFLVTFY